MRPWRPRGAPLAVQVIALLLLTLVVAQLITAATVLLLHPPRPPLYHQSEIVTALKGGSLDTRLGQRMTRRLSPSPPPPGQATPAGVRGPSAWIRRDLAEALGVGETSVRFEEQRGFRGDLRLFDKRPRGFGEDRGPPPGPAPGPAPARIFQTRPGAGSGPGPDHGVFGEFTAAVRQSSGQWLIVASPPEPFPNAWQRRMLLWLAAAFAVMAPLGYLFARRMTAPLGDFARAAERLGRDPRGEPLELNGPAEIGTAARAFNAMQGRLKRYVEDRTAMVAAISHDLRTPLARIRFKLEAAPQDLRARIGADVGQMESMIESVLSFIRDANAPQHRERIDLRSLLECLVDEAGAGERISLNPGPAPVVDGDLVSLQRLFQNLIDNAVKYGVCAEVNLRTEGEEAVVEVSDHGPGLGADEMERVFEPFYRAEKARTLDDRGVGLGLAVARSVARAHGGDVRLISRPEGLTARATLPLPPRR